MQYKKSKEKLHVKLTGDFNLKATCDIEKLMSDRPELFVDMSECRFADSNAIIFLEKLLNSHKKVQIINPPDIFFEVVSILGIHKKWDLDKMVQP